MTCIRTNWGFLCINLVYRLRLADGRRVFMMWHSYCGPTFYRDAACNREIDNWWDSKLIVDQLGWFVNRGKLA